MADRRLANGTVNAAQFGEGPAIVLLPENIGGFAARLLVIAAVGTTFISSPVVGPGYEQRKIGFGEATSLASFVLGALLMYFVFIDHSGLDSKRDKILILSLSSAGLMGLSFLFRRNIRNR